MADNCSSIEPWSYRPAFSDTCWISDAFTRDTETLTRALQISLSTDSDSLAVATVAAAGNNPSFLVKPEPAVSASASDTEAASRRIRNPILSSPSGKISKRKSRTTKRSTTTFIAADPANFRQMVQQVTGIRFGGAPSYPAPKPAEPQTPGSQFALQQNCLPTPDPLAFLMDRTVAAGVGPNHAANGSLGAAVEGTAFDLEPFYPILESWGVM